MRYDIVINEKFIFVVVVIVVAVCYGYDELVLFKTGYISRRDYKFSRFAFAQLCE